ncbi:MAG: sulfatase, partial [Proteobacteria bacterium]|nr:sulfatase [Pseudomonadota bacterium]
MLVLWFLFMACSCPNDRELPEATFMAPQSAGPGPNVVLITLDTTRADHLGSYNKQKVGLTPNLDAFAADGVRFHRTMAQAPATPISHASILSGLNPYQHGVRVIAASAGYRLSTEIPTLTTRLSDLNYTTGAVLSSYTVSAHFGLNHGFEHWDYELENTSHKDKEKQVQRRSDRTTDAAIEWLETLDPGPFFLWVHYWDPHDDKLQPPKKLVDKYRANVDRKNKLAWRKAMYRSEVNFVDSQFGRLIKAFKAGGDYDDTIFVVVADHGQGLGQHDWWHHRLLYEEQLRVPMIMRIPGWPRGTVVNDLVRTIDIYPTIMEA